MEVTLLEKIKNIEEEIVALKEEFRRWFMIYQKIIDLIIPEEDVEEDELEAIRRKEKLLKLEDVEKCIES